MHLKVIFGILVVWSVPSLSCKSSPPPCPVGFWEIPIPYHCSPKSGRTTGNCANDGRCLNYKLLCDGEVDIGRKAFFCGTGLGGKVLYGDPENVETWTLEKPDQRKPDEDLCTEEFCATLPGGRTIRCPGTTRCIAPYTKFFSGTNIPIGPICEEVDRLQIHKFRSKPLFWLNNHIYLH